MPFPRIAACAGTDLHASFFSSTNYPLKKYKKTNASYNRPTSRLLVCFTLLLCLEPYPGSGVIVAHLLTSVNYYMQFSANILQLHFIRPSSPIFPGYARKSPPPAFSPGNTIITVTAPRAAGTAPLTAGGINRGKAGNYLRRSSPARRKQEGSY